MEQQAFVSKVTAHLRADDRVRGLWLSGSTARGTNDAYSDVDMLAVVSERGFDELVDAWPDIVERIVSTIYVKKLDFGRTIVFNQITHDWLRFDLMLGRPDVLSGRSQSTLRSLFDRDDLGAILPKQTPVVGSSPATVSRIVQEFLRVLGLLPVAVGRNDYVVAASGSGLLRTMLIDLMVEFVEVEDRGGALHLATSLHTEHYELLQRLPPIMATYESAVAVHRACAATFLPLAQQLCERTDVPWPSNFATAALARLGSVPEEPA